LRARPWATAGAASQSGAGTRSGSSSRHRGRSCTNSWDSRKGQPLASGPFALSPHMQRDHRLRRLLHAFAPTSRERWAEVTGEALSSSPPLKAADVFEYWCTAVLAFAARTRGWTLESKTGRQDRPDGGVPVSHRSAFRSDDARFTIWFQPDIASTSPSGLQSMDVRMRQGIDVQPPSPASRTASSRMGTRHLTLPCCSSWATGAVRLPSATRRSQIPTDVAAATRSSA
jgi:hypothetical protein